MAPVFCTATATVAEFFRHILLLFMPAQVRLSSADSDAAKKKTKLKLFGLHQSHIDIQGVTGVCSTGEPLDWEPRSDPPVIQRQQTLLHPAAEPTFERGDSDPGLQPSTLWPTL